MRFFEKFWKYYHEIFTYYKFAKFWNDFTEVFKNFLHKKRETIRRFMVICQVTTFIEINKNLYVGM